MDEQAAVSPAKPKSNKTWLIVGVVVLICCCLAVGAAVLAWPTISGLLGAGATGLYSGRADDVLKQDVLTIITNYEASQNGCTDVTLFVGAETLSPEQTGDGSWVEMWQVVACDASHVYSITFTPSPQGGTDFSVRPVDQ
jgi:hypothetical protein